jgi:hypothetical protein
LIKREKFFKPAFRSGSYKLQSEGGKSRKIELFERKASFQFFVAFYCRAMIIYLLAERADEKYFSRIF